MMADTSEEMVNTHAPTAIVPDDQLLSALVEFSAAAGHEINNPLGVILGRVQLLLQQEDDPVRRQSLETIAGQAWANSRHDWRRDDVCRSSAAVCRGDSSRRSGRTGSRIGRSAECPYGSPSPADISLKIDAHLTAWGDRDQFAAVLAELLHNALHPSVAATQVDILAEPDPRDATFCRLIIRDNGRGLTPEEATHLFNPFYSGRQAGRGLGFGLSKAWRLAEQNGGTLKVSARVDPETHPDNEQRSADTDSTEFILRWPRAEQSEQSV